MVTLPCTGTYRQGKAGIHRHFWTGIYCPDRCIYRQGNPASLCF